MYVVKRDGRKEAVHFDKITARLKKLSYGLSTEFCDPVLVAQKVCMGVYKGVTTAQLDELAAETAAGMTATHPDYALLAARIAVSNLHKKTKKSFSETVKDMYAHVNQESGLPAPLIADDVYEIIMKHAERLDSEVIYDRDFDYDYFGFKTLERSYLLKVRPSHPVTQLCMEGHKGRERLDSLCMAPFPSPLSLVFFQSNGNSGGATTALVDASGSGDTQDGNCVICLLTYPLSPQSLLAGEREGGGAAATLVDASGVGIHKEVQAYTLHPFPPFSLFSCQVNGKVVERPQHMLMRVAVGIHKADIEAAVQTYHLMSQRWFTHASPTLFNSGTPRPQLSSCFLVCMKEDSIEGIYDTLKECAVISKSAGGIGLSAHCIRAKGSYIRGTNGMSNGIVPMLRVFNDTARYVDQGGGKRKVPMLRVFKDRARHMDQGGGKLKDVFDFLDLRKNHGKEENRARDLFYGLWIPDLFMQRVQSNMPWSLFCPNEAPGLADCWGEEFEALYLRYEREVGAWLAGKGVLVATLEMRGWGLAGLADCWGEEFEALYLRYEREGRAKRVIPSQKLWFAIFDLSTICEAQIETGNPYMLFKVGAALVFDLSTICEAQIETGNPYMLFKDACNRKSNQQNLGTIKCSNLCTEIVEYTSPEETAVCNLVSIALPRFVREKGVPSEAHPSKLTGSLNHDQRFFDFEKLGEITEVVTRNLNRVIDVNYYPTESARRSNMRHRPIGLGVQGLADAFILLGMPFDSPQARQLNRDIFETIYFRTSCRLKPCLVFALHLTPPPPPTFQARQLNRDIFETIYYHALRTSCLLAREEGTYESYPGCPVSKDWPALRASITAHGLCDSLHVAPTLTSPHALCLVLPPGILQPDMWGVTPSDRWDWAALRADIAAHGLRNSLLVSPCRCRLRSMCAAPLFPPQPLQGILQPDMWGVTPSDRWDWAALRADIAAHGLRNSLLVAPMPTASTSQILGNNECFEPYTSNIYSRRVLRLRNSLLVAPMPTASTSQILGNNECFEPYTSNIYSRRVLSGEFVVVNKHLLNDLTHLGLWSPGLKNEIMYRNGSVEGIDEIPQRLRDIYKTVWEMKQRAIVDMAADRGAFIDQSQSLNIHMDAPTFGKLTSLHFYTWGKGLKTGMYYLRTRGAADAIKFTVDAEAAKRVCPFESFGKVCQNALKGDRQQGSSGNARQVKEVHMQARPASVSVTG
ncbi:unnamed protein product [Closterium sp. Yama58-4]|nr:unnamed protein product [Closterium sp. Yama58-4]